MRYPGSGWFRTKAKSMFVEKKQSDVKGLLTPATLFSLSCSPTDPTDSLTTLLFLLHVQTSQVFEFLLPPPEHSCFRRPAFILKGTRICHPQTCLLTQGLGAFWMWLSVPQVWAISACQFLWQIPGNWDLHRQFFWKIYFVFNWRVIILQYSDGFWHSTTWISHSTQSVLSTAPSPHHPWLGAVQLRMLKPLLGLFFFVNCAGP